MFAALHAHRRSTCTFNRAVIYDSNIITIAGPLGSETQNCIPIQGANRIPNQATHVLVSSLTLSVESRIYEVWNGLIGPQISREISYSHSSMSLFRFLPFLEELIRQRWIIFTLLELVYGTQFYVAFQNSDPSVNFNFDR